MMVNQNLIVFLLINFYLLEMVILLWKPLMTSRYLCFLLYFMFFYVYSPIYQLVFFFT